MNYLKPCQFCGGNDLAVIEKQNITDRNGYNLSFVMCLNINCEDSRGPTEFGYADAVMSWNRRKGK